MGKPARKTGRDARTKQMSLTGRVLDVIGDGIVTPEYVVAMCRQSVETHRAMNHRHRGKYKSTGDLSADIAIQQGRVVRTCIHRLIHAKRIARTMDGKSIYATMLRKDIE